MALKFLGVIWLAAVSYGLVIMLNYENRPGNAGESPSEWPATSELGREPLLPTLVMAVHPHCPCTRASLEELSRLVARTDRKIRSHLLFFLPDSSAAGWESGALLDQARRIAGASVLIDRDGAEARKFGLSVSGQVAFYDTKGDLRFAGGITASRGHAGDNLGKSAIMDFVKNAAIDIPARTPAFGCSLLENGMEPGCTDETHSHEDQHID